jgi:hypothetical protein
MARAAGATAAERHHGAAAAVGWARQLRDDLR